MCDYPVEVMELCIDLCYSDEVV